MGDVGEAFKDMKGYVKQKRKSNTVSSTDILKDKGIEFTSNNGGSHLIIKGKDGLIDFWPSTGKFIARNGKRGRGVFKLLKLL